MRGSSTFTSIGVMCRGSSRVDTSRTSSRARLSLSALGNWRSPRASTSSSALSSRPKVDGPMLPTISGTFLRASLSRAFFARSSVSAAKPTQYGFLRQPGHRGEDVGVLGQRERRRRGAAVFLDLALRVAGGAPIGHRGGGHEHVLRRRQRQHRVVHLLRAGHVDAAHVARRRQVHRPGHQRDLGTGFLRRTCDGEAHLAAGQVGDAAHRVDGLERRTGGDQHAPAGQQLGLQAPRSPRRTTRRPRACAHRRSRRTPGRRCPGPSTHAPSARTRATLRCVAGWAHISRFIAGASNSGTRSIGRARHSRLSRSSARPLATLAMKSADAGATTNASASRVRLMCAMLLASRASHWLV